MDSYMEVDTTSRETDSDISGKENNGYFLL